MELPASNFFALDSSRKREVHFILCRLALVKWETYANAYFPVTYKDSVVGMNHTMDERLPRDSFECSRAGLDKKDVTKRYMEPITAMQDEDFALPENVACAYYAIYNLFRKYVQHEEVDDWLIVNQCLSSEEDASKWTPLLSDAMRIALARTTA